MTHWYVYVQHFELVVHQIAEEKKQQVKFEPR